MHDVLLIPPSAAFWPEAARAVLGHAAAAGAASAGDVGLVGLSGGASGASRNDLSDLRVIVPTFAHASLLRAALTAELGPSSTSFIPPRINTLSGWLDLLPPAAGDSVPAADSERLMSLYGELRQHAWLKKLFTARRNTDLLPLAQTLLTLCDELTRALLPCVRLTPDAPAQRWQAALAQLPPSARTLLSDEAQLVWSIWNSQLDGRDACAARFARLLGLAGQAPEPLVWIAPVEPDAFDQAFLDLYRERQPVKLILLDWRSGALPACYAAAWNEMLEQDEGPAPVDTDAIARPAGVALLAARSLEDEAVSGARTVLDWLAAEKTQVAIIAQDRVVARRMRALLERAGVFVADETGWKLSTTRAAAALSAWFEVVSTRAATAALLDLLKSPFVFSAAEGKPEHVMAIELALRRENVRSGWSAAAAAVAAATRRVQQKSDTPSDPMAGTPGDLMQRLEKQAGFFGGRHSLCEWLERTLRTLRELEMQAAFEADAAGMQLLDLMETIRRDCEGVDEAFSFAEWRAFINLQLEATPFVAADQDRRVVMLPLNGAHLRRFDAVLMVGADADHLPSRASEALFFANAVRRELGLATRESRQRQQLRDFTELLCSNQQVVLSWQAHRNGEPNAVSPWIARLQLVLQRSAEEPLPMHRVALTQRTLSPAMPSPPAPVAPHLLPQKLSASGYNSLVACPYQFFATRMLGLSGLDELSDMPEKRDYGDWLHRILASYHDTVLQQGTPVAGRALVLSSISEQVFREEIDRNAAALAYYSRWQKAMPAYLVWAAAREADGWRFALGERWFEKRLEWDGGAVLLHGRIDRIDENAEGERAVLDYKTRDTRSLSRRIEEREDHQLAFYALLSDARISAAHYVALEPLRDRTGDAPMADLAAWQQVLEQNIRDHMSAIAAGAPLNASGIETICQYCDVRGLCRKGAW